MLNLDPPKLINDFPMTAPSCLGASTGGEAIGYMAYNVTPKHSYVDLHVGMSSLLYLLSIPSSPCTLIHVIKDRGTETIATVCHKAVKFWLLWPPTSKNEQSFYSQAEQHHGTGTKTPTSKKSKKPDHIVTDRLCRIGIHLEGGMITKTTNKEALFIPAGWIHCVLTTEGGFLAGVTWGNTTRLDTLLHCLKLEAQFHHKLEEMIPNVEFLMEIINIFFKAPFQESINLGMKKWLQLLDILKESGLEWGKEPHVKSLAIMKVLSKQKLVTLPESCVCGSTAADMAAHLLTHVWGTAAPRHILRG